MGEINNQRNQPLGRDDSRYEENEQSRVASAGWAIEPDRRSQPLMSARSRRAGPGRASRGTACRRIGRRWRRLTPSA